MQAEVTSLGDIASSVDGPCQQLQPLHTLVADTLDMLDTRYYITDIYQNSMWKEMRSTSFSAASIQPV